MPCKSKTSYCHVIVFSENFLRKVKSLRHCDLQVNLDLETQIESQVTPLLHVPLISYGNGNSGSPNARRLGQTSSGLVPVFPALSTVIRGSAVSNKLKACRLIRVTVQLKFGNVESCRLYRYLLRSRMFVMITGSGSNHTCRLQERTVELHRAAVEDCLW
jgi:hypothetical protein